MVIKAAAMAPPAPPAPTPTFQALVGDLRTGTIATRVPLLGCSWQQVFDGAGTINNAQVNVQDPDVRSLDLRHTAAAGKAFLAIQYDQTILNAGPIWTHHYNRATGILTLGAAGLWSLFDHRKVIPTLTQPLAVGAAQSTAGDTTFATTDNKSLGDIAAALVAQAMTHVGGNLPLVLPAAQGQTPGNARTYYGYELAWVGARIAELTAVQGGPEIRFQPRYKSGSPNQIEWVMLVGTPAQPQLFQGGLDWFFDASVPQSVVSDIDVDVDATIMGTRAWEVGTGSQRGVMLSQADSTALTAVGYPLLEVESSHTTVNVQSTLDAYAAQDLVAVNRPAEVWKVKVRNDGAPADGAATQVASPKLGSYSPGDYCQVVIGDDPYLAPGPRRSRILQIDGDYGFECTLTLATMKAEI